MGRQLTALEAKFFNILPGRYSHQPYFYSDLFDLGYEAVGELDSGMEIIEDWKNLFHKGVVHYLRDARLRGVLLWNT